MSADRVNWMAMLLQLRRLQCVSATKYLKPREIVIGSGQSVAELSSLLGVEMELRGASTFAPVTQSTRETREMRLGGAAVCFYQFIKLEALPIATEDCCVVVVFTRPLLKDGGVAEDHGVPESGQLLGAWTRGRRETVAGQCRMR